MIAPLATHLKSSIAIATPAISLELIIRWIDCLAQICIVECSCGCSILSCDCVSHCDVTRVDIAETSANNRSYKDVSDNNNTLIFSLWIARRCRRRCDRCSLCWCQHQHICHSHFVFDASSKDEVPERQRRRTAIFAKRVYLDEVILREHLEHSAVCTGFGSTAFKVRNHP